MTTPTQASETSSFVALPKDPKIKLLKEPTPALMQKLIKSNGAPAGPVCPCAD